MYIVVESRFNCFVSTAAPSCDVTVVAISDSVVTCRADCNNTISITFSSTVPGDNNLQTCGGQPTSPSIGASAGTALN